MNSITGFSNHLNLLVGKYFSPQVQEGLSVQNLQKIAISTIFKSMHEGNLTLEELRLVPFNIQDKIILEASSFSDWVLTKEFLTDSIAKELLDRFEFSRKFLEQGTDVEILLRRIFETAINRSSVQEQMDIIDKKRQLFFLNNSAYFSVNVVEKVQLIIGKMMKSKAAKISLTLLMVAITVVALRGLYSVRPNIILPIIHSYIKILNLIPWALNISQRYRYFSLSLSILSGCTSCFISGRRADLARILKVTSLLSGCHWACSQLSASMGINLSRIIYYLLAILPYGNSLLLFPYLAPIVFPIVKMVQLADSSTSLASRILEATSGKLTIWRTNRELQEARNLWIQHFLIKET